MVCAIALQDLIHCQAKRRPPHARRSRRCAGSATPASILPPRSVCRRRPSVASCGGSASTGSRDLEPAEPIRRYQREHPGELIHIDIKKLGKFNRVGHRITGDRTGQSNLRCRGRGPAGNTSTSASTMLPGSPSVRVMKNERQGMRRRLPQGRRRLLHKPRGNRRACHDRQRFLLQIFCLPQSLQAPPLKHIRTKPYTPKTNGKAERFIQTSLREWAYAQAYNTSKERAAELPRWLHRYNWHRPHGGLGSTAAHQQTRLAGNNLLRLHI